MLSCFNLKPFNRCFLLCIMFVFCAKSTFSQSISLRELLATPYVGKIVAASKANRLAFAVNDSGHRNIYYVQGPAYKMHKITAFDSDDAQEISSLAMSADGKWVIFVRGGDHGANTAPVATNSASLVKATSIEIYSYNVEENRLYTIGLGNYPSFHPDGKHITYSRSGQVWTAPLDKDNGGKQLFHVRGIASNMQWSPDGSKLAFVAKRGDYSFIGIFSTMSNRIKWISPSFYTDAFPQWSPKGDKLAFVRREAVGGPLDSLTSFSYQPWSIRIADVSTGKSKEMYKAPTKREATFPRIAGQVNLQWKHADYITFMSYEDGWPHLYRLDSRNNKVQQLTKGTFEINDFAYNNAGTKIVFAANIGLDTYDFERSHIGVVEVESTAMSMISNGEGIEMAPFYFNNDNLIGFRSSTYNSPPQPNIYDMASKKNIAVGNALFDDKDIDFVRPEQLFITAEDGIKSSAQLFKPRNGKSNGAALVYIHGGPRRQMYLGWHHSDYYFNDYIVNQYLAQLGYTVLSINYRMGTGYGFDFQHPDSSGNLGASEYLDVLAAGKWLQQQKGIDPAKVGLFGGSYGGYLTAMGLAKNSDIFKVGVDIHGVHNRQRKQNPDFYAPDFELASRLNWDSSPSRWVDSWQSPVLLIHADDDQNVAFSQSIDLYKRLKSRNIAVEALVIPDENHHWQMFENLVNVKEATVEFLNRKLHNNK